MGKRKITLNELKGMDRETFTADMLAQIIGCNPHYLRVAARKQPELLGFPALIYGSRVKFPKEGFIRFMEGRSV